MFRIDSCYCQVNARLCRLNWRTTSEHVVYFVAIRTLSCNCVLALSEGCNLFCAANIPHMQNRIRYVFGRTHLTYFLEAVQGHAGHAAPSHYKYPVYLINWYDPFSYRQTVSLLRAALLNSVLKRTNQSWCSRRTQQLQFIAKSHAKSY